MNERSIARPRLGVVDLFNETAAAISSRPGRTISTAVGTVLGVGAFVATLGLSATAANQVVVQLDSLVARQVVVRTPATDESSADAMGLIPWGADQRLERLNGVESVGMSGKVNIGTRLSSSTEVFDPLSATEYVLPVIAITPQFFDQVKPDLNSGRLFDSGHNARRDDVVILGSDAARQLGIQSVNRQPSVSIGDERFTVIGILQDVAARPQLSSSIIMPEQTATTHFGLTSPDEVTITVQFGAAELLSSQAPLALLPEDPSSLVVSSPPDPRATRQGIERDTSALIYVMAAIALTVGALGIANTTLVSVLERTGEIGLRRALGATRAHIARHFLTEAGLVGFIGGIVGTTMGLVTIIGYSAWRSWTPVLDPVVLLLSPPMGALVGLLAGAYPSWRASRLEPVVALR